MDGGKDEMSVSSAQVLKKLYMAHMHWNSLECKNLLYSCRTMTRGSRVFTPY